MALVSAPLAALWAPMASREEPWALDCAPSQSQNPSQSQSSSRRESNESHETPVGFSSSTLNSSGTTESSGMSESSGAKASKKKLKQKRAPRGPDVVLHVHDCAFAVHTRVLRQKCHILHGFLLRLREQNAIGLLAGGDGDDETQLVPFTVVAGGHGASEDEDTAESRNAKFVLRQRDPMTTPRNSSPHRHGRCPVYPRQQLSDRATATTSSPRSSRFPKVCCIAHQKTDDSNREEPRPRSQEEFSPGKENYASAHTPSPNARAQARVVLAPKMPFAPTTKLTLSQTSIGPNDSSSPPSSGSSERSPLSSPTKLAPNALVVELIGASADAVAAFIEFLYSGKTCGLNEGNAATVTSLCKWFCMEDRLLYAALIMRAKSVSSVGQWMDVLLCCTNLRSDAKKNLIIDFLIQRLINLSPSEYCAAMNLMPLHRLAAVEDADILGRIMVSMVNKLRRTDTWKRLAFTIELWLFWSYGRRFAGPLAGLSHSDSVRQPMSLLDFHKQFVVWDPVTHIDDVEVTGLDAYVRPTTLFSFGPFSFQVRFEPNRKPLICWRVVRDGTPADTTDETEKLYFRPGVEPSFCIRGNLTLVYKCSPEGPLLQEGVSIRYSHTKDTFGKWQVLLAAPSPRATLMLPEPESEEKAQEPESSMDDPTPQSSYTEGSAQPTVPVRTAAPLPDSNSDDSFEVMTAHFTGQFFVWGHKLCNLYHFLIVSTLFYLVPLDSSRELRFEATIERMRELPLDTLILVLQSDRLRVPDGETTLAIAVTRLCLSDYGTIHFSMDEIRALFQCVRWCFVDLEQIMLTLEHSRRELKLYELVEQQLRDHYNSGTARRCAPWYVDDENTPYLPTTTLVEFQIEAGDRSLSPSKFPPSQ